MGRPQELNGQLDGVERCLVVQLVDMAGEIFIDSAMIAIHLLSQ